MAELNEKLINYGNLQRYDAKIKEYIGANAGSPEVATKNDIDELFVSNTLTLSAYWDLNDRYISIDGFYALNEKANWRICLATGEDDATLISNLKTSTVVFLKIADGPIHNYGRPVATNCTCTYIENIGEYVDEYEYVVYSIYQVTNIVDGATIEFSYSE